MKKKIKLTQLILISLSAIVGLKSLPLFAEVGVSLIFFLGLSTLLFFIPISMAIAELSSTWPHSGGCYYWIKKAYGENTAFLVIWAYWIESIIWFPTMLIFIVAMLAHAMTPIYQGLENNSYFLIFGIISIFWILTFINFYGIKISAKFSSIGVLIGTIIPIILIITFGIFWLIKGNNINLIFKIENIVPKLDLNNLVFFSGILLGISGIEIISFYIKDVENPEKNIAKAVIISSFFIIIIYLLGSLSVAIVVPKNELSFASGIIQALKIFFKKINLECITPLIAFFLLLGSLSGMNTWIIGPAKGLFEAANDNFLPHFLKKTNKDDVPTNILIIQALIGSILSILFFTYINSINGLIWIFVCLSFQFASILYIMIFFSVMKLRKLYPNIKRPYKAPAIKLLSFLGITICSFTFLISYIQPANIETTEKFFYLMLLLISSIILALPALIFSYLKYKKN
ncbi:MAG TPA: APC family permease [Candidatus Azoamicus sp.]